MAQDVRLPSRSVAGRITEHCDRRRDEEGERKDPQGGMRFDRNRLSPAQSAANAVLEACKLAITLMQPNNIGWSCMSDPGPSEHHPYCYRYPHPAVTTDVVLFSLTDDQLQLLLIERGNDPFRGHWALPGGFVDIDEDLPACAARELAEETGVQDLTLEQIGAYGRPGRDPRERVISVVYMALAVADHLTLNAGDDAAAAAWFPFARLPPLAFDHDEIIAAAHRRLIAQLDDPTTVSRLLPETCTHSERQRAYQALIDTG
jgi:8-oxo-dGTP diphosphatase